MRPLEFASLIVLAAASLLFAIPVSKRPRWGLHLPLGPAAVLLFQLFLEGYRWQMLPAYLLGVIVLLAGLPAMIKGPGSAGRFQGVLRTLAIIGSLAGLAIVWLTVELCVQVPAFRMPETG